MSSLRRKATNDQAPAKNVKKPKKAEVNYLPPHPQGETDESLEQERVNLLYEVTKRDNYHMVSQKMVKTFSFRRQEIIYEAPAVSNIMQRWPASFDAAQVKKKKKNVTFTSTHISQFVCMILQFCLFGPQINDEFHRITTVNLDSTFMAKLDLCTSKLMDVVSTRGGASGAKIQKIKNVLLEV